MANVTVRIIFAVWLVLTALGTAFPSWRLWAFHLPAFLPIRAQITFFVMALVFLFAPS